MSGEASYSESGPRRLCQDPINAYDLDGTCIGPAVSICIRIGLRIAPWAIRAALAAGGAGLGAKASQRVLVSIIRNPKALEGQSGSKLVPALKALVRDAGWQVGPLTRGASTGKGIVIGDGGNRLIQFHPGSARHFGGHPYWKVSSAEGATVRFLAKP